MRNEFSKKTLKSFQINSFQSAKVFTFPYFSTVHATFDTQLSTYSSLDVLLEMIPSGKGWHWDDLMQLWRGLAYWQPGKIVGELWKDYFLNLN